MVSPLTLSPGIPGGVNQLHYSCSWQNIVPDALSRPDPTGKVPNNPALFLATGRIISSSPDLSSSNPPWSISEKPALFLATGRTSSSSTLVPAPGGVQPVKQVLQEFDVSSLSRFQAACSSVQEMKTNPSLSVIVHPLRTGDILCDISTGSLRPLVPLH